MNGQLSEIPLAEILCEITAAKLSGALGLKRERAKAVVYAQDGGVAQVATNLRPYRLGASLRRWGAIREEMLASVVTDAMTDAAAGAALVAAGACTKVELQEYLRRQAEESLLPLLLWTDGQWSFDPRGRLPEPAPLRLELPPLLLESARRLPAAYVATRWPDAGETLSPVAASDFGQLSLLPAEAFVLSRVDAPLRLRDLLALAGLPEEQTRQLAYTLALGGLLQRAGGGGSRRAFTPEAIAQAHAATAAVVAAAANNGDRANPGAQTRTAVSAGDAAVDRHSVDSSGAPATTGATQLEIDALLTRACATTHYALLGVDLNAPPGEIKRAYYALAKRFHPDRFLREVDDEMRVRVEQAFARIAQAYEILKDEKARSAYDKTLSANSSPAGGINAGQRTMTTPEPAAGGGNALPPKKAADLFQQGVAAAQVGNHAAAAAFFAEAVRRVPGEANYHAFYGCALARSANNAATRRQAESELRAAIMLDGGNASYRVWLAELYQTLGQLRRAEAELERALTIDPKLTAARQMLDRIKERKPKY